MITFEQYTAKQRDAIHIVSIVKSFLEVEIVAQELTNQLEEKAKLLSSKQTQIIDLKAENERLQQVIKHLESCLPAPECHSTSTSKKSFIST